jgi:hypothetical protein
VFCLTNFDARIRNIHFSFRVPNLGSVHAAPRPKKRERI